MKYIVCFLLVCWRANADLPEKQANQIADAIYIIEGGKKTKYPYGIKSINTRGNSIKARRICINTIQNTHCRWLKENKPISFLDYLAQRYCPISVDADGHKRWKTNIRKFVAEIN